MNSDIYLVRHGLKSSEDKGLDKKYGVKEAKELGIYLNELMKGQSNIIIASPHVRTLDTLRVALSQIDEDTDFVIKIDKTISKVPTTASNNEHTSNGSLYYFARKLKHMALERKKYDNIIVMASSEVNECLYYWINDRDMSLYSQNTCEVIVANGVRKGRSVFNPEDLNLEYPIVKSLNSIYRIK